MSLLRSLKRTWLAWGHDFLRQLWFELMKMFGRKRTHIGFGVFVVLELSFAFFLKRPKSVEWFQGMLERRAQKLNPLGFGIDVDYFYSALTMSHMILSGVVVLLGGLFLSLVAGDIVSKEEEEGTLRMVLSRPVTRGRVLAVKYAACMVFTAVLISFAAISSLITGFLFWKADGGLFATSKDLGMIAFHDFEPGLWRYFLSIPFLVLSMMIVTSVAFLFSCLRMKPATATILTLALLFGDLILRKMEPLEDIKDIFITARMNTWQLVIGQTIDWWLLAQNFFVLGLVCAAAYFLGWLAFSRRDFKS